MFLIKFILFFPTITILNIHNIFFQSSFPSKAQQTHKFPQNKQFLSCPDYIISISYSKLFLIVRQQIQMINQHRSASLHRTQQHRTNPIADVYDEIMKNFDKEAQRIRFKFSNPSFDDSQLVRPRKTLPKIQIEPERKGRMKFYSNKLVVNQAVYINQRKQYTPEHFEQQQFKKLHIPQPKQVSILSDRNKRIMELYRRSARDSDSSPNKIKFSKPIQNPNKLDDIQVPAADSNTHPLKKFPNLRASQKRMLDVLRQAKQKRRKLQPPHMKPQRSKSNIVISAYSIESQNPQKNTLQCKKIEEQKVQNQQQAKQKANRRLKYQPKRQHVVVRRRFNWKNQPLPLNNIERQQFHRLIRFYHNIPEPTPIHSGFYKAYIGVGNNCALIKKLLKDRGYWTIVETLEQEPNFVWTQIKSTKYSSNLTTSTPQYRPILRKFADLQTNQQLSTFIKHKKNDYISSIQKILQPKHFLHLMNQIRVRFQSATNVQYFNKIKKVFIDFLQENVLKDCEGQLWAGDIKLHNHMDNAGAIGDKKQLLYMMTKYCEIFNEDLDNFIPRTVHLQNPEQYSQIFDRIPGGPWILKPGQATNRGQGITVHTNKQTLISEINKKKKHKIGVKFTNIIQQYIEPLLYYGRKFDIRIWVLWTGRKLWWYRQGYLRTSSKQFTLKNLNKFIHLTNDAIQSQSQDFGKHEPANKLSFHQFQKFLESQHNYHSFHTEMLKQMKDLAMKAFRMGNIVFDNQNKMYNFELFGLDFLIDNKFKPWLIQCNTNPCIEINCSLLARLVPNMLENVMNLTVDTYFPPPTKKKSKESSIWNHETFKFELLYNGQVDTQIQQKLLLTQIKIDYQQPEIDIFEQSPSKSTQYPRE